MKTMTNPWNEFHGPNLGYLLEQYDLFMEDAESVDESLRSLFNQWGAPQLEETEIGNSQEQGYSASYILHKMNKLIQVLKLADQIREMGHKEADIYPLEKQNSDLFNLSAYGLTEADVREIPPEMICPEVKGKLADGLAAINHLKQAYTRFIGFEIQQTEQAEKEWLQQKIENDFIRENVSRIDKKDLLTQLYRTEKFEQFLHKTFVGQKRFSVEGLETMVPTIDEVVRLSADTGVNDVMISMAHRGRLNVLAHVMEKPYEAIFSQFQHAKYDGGEQPGWSTGDVKYHMGAVVNRKIDDKEIRVTLANNPSHLEVAGTVVEGYARAAQDDRGSKGYSKHDPKKAVPILVHGDAAFPGQGIVAEILNYAKTKAYQTGGTIHLIANNRIGFTTESGDSRSTDYASDMAKGFAIPVFHVNAEYPEASIAAIRLAFDYRQTFHKDVLIDLIGYRRLGHNEMDEPMATNPLMYHIVRSHPTITAVYGKQLLDEKVLTEKQIEEIDATVAQFCTTAFDKVSEEHEEVRSIEEMIFISKREIPDIDTTVKHEILTKINMELLEWPENFNVFGKLRKILERRREVFEKSGKIDWAHGEALAFATILNDGTPIRFTGQDSERGTFSHRNLILSDEKTGEKYSPMHTISTSNASFDLYNSVLSEAAILGFEYGYNVIAKDTLVFWEAQFGDFANGAQMIFDQFISAGQAKWGQNSGIVVLLPHGYEGQGPEHSSGRMERFLQSAAENNWTVANLSSSAQYFHLLRRQAAILGTENVRPLILMTPKSLLRNASAACSLEEFTNGQFQPVIEQPGLGNKPDKVERVVFCTGRLAVELSDKVKDAEETEWLDIIRVEELYPFPEKQIKQFMNKYKHVKEVIWAQEEPMNMGAWSYISPRLQKTMPEGLKLTYVGRPEMASPSEGDPLVHKKEQQRIVNQLLSPRKVKVTQ